MPMIEHVIQTVPWDMKMVAGVPPEYKCSRGWVQIPHTKGPAETAKNVLEHYGPESCLIIDSDILNATNDLAMLTELVTTGIGVLVCKSANPAFSYVDKTGYFSRIKEKERISEYAVRGAYYVSASSMSEFMTVLDEVCSGYAEPYMSHVFDLMGCKKIAMATVYTPIDWGTPRDVKLSGARIVLDNGESDVHDKRSQREGCTS